MADSLFLSLLVYLRIDEIPFTDYEGDGTESRRGEAKKKKGDSYGGKERRRKGTSEEHDVLARVG